MRTDEMIVPVLEHVLIPEENYKALLEYANKKVDVRVDLPKTDFIDYDKSVAVMEQFIGDALRSIENHNLDESVVSVTTQRFVIESPDLWPTRTLAHNHTLRFMESAYRVPEKIGQLRDKLIVENPKYTDAITYMCSRYLESYMDHVAKDVSYLEYYIGSADGYILTESVDDFKGYYMPEGLADTLIKIPGMIIVMLKKLLNGLNFTLTEAGKRFANRILVNNQVNEQAIQQIYQLYYAKARSGNQLPIRYPDPDQIHNLRQTYAVGFDAFTQQMVQAITSNPPDFRSVDQGVVKMINNFSVLIANKTLPQGASYEEFRRAVLSIANNIIMMEQFMKALKTIDDTITQKYLDQGKLEQMEKEILGNSSILGIQTAGQRSNGDMLQNRQAIRPTMQQTNASVESEEDPFDALFELANKDTARPLTKGNSTPEVQAADAAAKNGTGAKRPNIVQRAGAAIADGTVQGVNLVKKAAIPTVVSTVLLGLIRWYAEAAIPLIANEINGIMGIKEDAEPDDVDGEPMTEEPDPNGAPTPQPDPSGGVNNTGTVPGADVTPPQSEPQAETGEQQSQGVFSKISDFLFNDDGIMNSDIFKLDKLQAVIDKFKSLKQLVTKFTNDLTEKVKELIIKGGQGQPSNDANAVKPTESGMTSPPAENAVTQSNPPQNSADAKAGAGTSDNVAKPMANSVEVTDDEFDLMSENTPSFMRGFNAGSLVNRLTGRATNGADGMVQNAKDTAAGFFTAATPNLAQKVSNVGLTIKGAKALLDLRKMGSKINTIGKKILSTNGENLSENIVDITTSVLGKTGILMNIGKLQGYIETGGQEGLNQFMHDDECKKALGIAAAVACGLTTIVLVQIGAVANPAEAIMSLLGKSRSMAKSGQLPAPKRAVDNMAATKSTVNPIATELWNNADEAVKNLWQYVNGWLYGGQPIKGTNQKTVGIGEMIKQELQSLAPYVNLQDVIQFETMPQQ